MPKCFTNWGFPTRWYCLGSPARHFYGKWREKLFFWRSLTFQVFLDVLNTVEMTSTLLEELARALPSFSAYANIFKDSEIQLIRDPLVTLYREIILFGLEAVKILNRGFVRT
jgi:hypothetical protein